MRIGVVGFSRTTFDHQAAQDLLRAELTRLAERVGKERLEIVSGYTNAGVPKIAYEIGRQLGLRLVGISARQALRVRSGVFPVDKVIIQGERFGDESQVFVDYIDGLIRVGGGMQSRREVELFRARFTDGTVGRRLKEFEVEWYGKQPVSKPKGPELLPETIDLGDGDHLLRFPAVESLRLGDKAFEDLWTSHPQEYHTVVMHGKEVKTPRWQQAYGFNYQYSGSRNNALPISDQLRPYLAWCQRHVDSRLNGLLLNWYDGNLDHYIGAHRDSTAGLAPDSPVVTISLGEERVFRMRPYRGKGFQDFTVGNGDVLVVPAATNERWTHEVPKFARYRGRRISVTVRAYTRD